jgi:aminopeptidase-like protein
VAKTAVVIGAGVVLTLVAAAIGAITWLARNEDRFQRINHGLVTLHCWNHGYNGTRRGAALAFARDLQLDKSRLAKLVRYSEN